MTGGFQISNAPDAAAMEREFHAAIASERRADRQGAKAFAQACREGDVDRLLQAADFLNDSTIDGWRLAMMRVGRLSGVSAEIRAAFLGIWIEAKHLPLEVGHRPTMARALHVLMPPVVRSVPLRLYRGTAARERKRWLYGFSWTTHRGIAQRFAEQAQVAEDGSVVLETIAPPDAVHLQREEEGYYDEGEVVVDPYKLDAVRVVERLPSSHPRR